MSRIYISETDYDHDPLVESLSKLSIVVVNTKSNTKEATDIIDLTLDSDSSSNDQDDYKCFKSDQLSEDILESIRSERVSTDQSFRDFGQIYLDNIPITGTLLRTLVKSSSWLNDEMINAFFKLLGAAYLNSIFLNSFFFSNLVSGVDVYSWIKKTTLKKSLFEYDHLIFPINHGNTHWSLGVLFIKEMDLVHYDSLGSSIGKIKSVYSKFMMILEKEAKENYLSRIDSIKLPLFTKVEDIKLSLKTRDSPSQADGSSCGVHACFTAHRVAKGEPLDFTSDQVLDYRKKMAISLALQ